MNLTKSFEFFNPCEHDDAINIIGCGSVGSTIAENIARLGVRKIVLWDFDKVEPHNIANQMFTDKDIGKEKVEAVKDMIVAINPDLTDGVEIKSRGWNGELLSGYVFLCVDNIETRRQIVESNKHNKYVKAMFDFRTRLLDAQHYAADWSSPKMRKDFYNSMDFSHEEAKEETPMSACNIELSVCPTVRMICAAGVANFMNFWSKKEIKKIILIDAFSFSIMSF